MKKIIVSFIVLLSLTAFKNTDARTYVSFDFFYSSLSPYGEWIEIDYDFYVWRPYHVRASWQPYTIGSWSWTSHGWYWDSYEPFGWATYHYGRWFYDDYYGWVWAPGYEWGPAWVEWRYNDRYIGWAPLPPYAVFDINFGIHFSINWVAPYRYWNFVGYDRFCHSHVNYYIIDNSTNINIYRNTKYRTNYHHRNGRIINGGVDRGYVERRGGYRLAEREIAITTNSNSYKNRSRSDNGRIEVYKPSQYEVSRTKKADRSVIKKSGRKSSLQVDKVTVSRKPKVVNGNDVKKIITRKNTIETKTEKQVRNNNQIRKPAQRSNNDVDGNYKKRTTPKDEKKFFKETTKRNKTVTSRPTVKKETDNRIKTKSIASRNSVKKSAGKSVTKSRSNKTDLKSTTKSKSKSNSRKRK